MVEDVSDSIGQNVARVREELAAACARAGRLPEEVTLMAVSKFHGAQCIAEAFNAGVRVFGESRVQEARFKAPKLPEGCELHLIGHLQRNKAKDAAQLFHTCQSIDRAETAQALSRHLLDTGRTMRVLLEMNTSAEASKFGVHSYDELRRLLDAVLELPALEIRGFMTIGPLTDNEREVRDAFSALRGAAERLRDAYPALSLNELSMGMSGDFSWAIAEGSTMVRIGTAIFGPREAV